MKKLTAYIKDQLRWLAVILCIAVMMVVTMLLNGISFMEIRYGLLLCLFVTVLAIATGYGRHREGFRQLEQMQENITVAPDVMKTPEYMYERQYQNCIRRLAQEKNNIRNEMAKRQQEMAEYYSMWVHQVKTPIAALKLLLDEEMNACMESEELDENDMSVINIRQEQDELFRIEQYVDMALQYTRLEAGTNDFVIQKVSLDEVIKPSIHKYARQFIHKKLSLDYTPQEMEVITDKKWLGFVIDQLLSNAIKYTRQGSITIRAEHTTASQNDSGSREKAPVKAAAHQTWYEKECDSTSEDGQHVHIIIEDTGIGISAEDLPRICEKGYTGYNGHADKYSTGIGLYLCKAILDKLGHRLVLTSGEGQGTRAEIVL